MANPVYDLKNPQDQIRLLNDQPSQGARNTVLWVIHKYVSRSRAAELKRGRD